MDNAQLNNQMPTPTGWQNFTADTSALCRRITLPAQSEQKSSAVGPRLCGMGNSGALIKPAIIKEYDDARAEGLYCKHLGDKVAPRVYRVSDRYESPEYYIMEYLEPVAPAANLLGIIEIVLETYVWHRQAVASPTPNTWAYALKERYGILSYPTYVHDQVTGLIHGDCTVANLMERITPADNRYIITDPVWYRHFVPSNKATDMGKMMQSAAGWEHVAYGQPLVEYEAPRFSYDEGFFVQAIFWCAVNMLRIRYREVRAEAPRPHVLEWCNGVLEICERMIGRHWE